MRTAIFVAPLRCPQTYARIAARLDGFAPVFVDMLAATRADDWTFDAEVAHLERSAGGARDDLVGFSGGGAVCLAYTVAHPEQVRSLTLIEPPWIGNDVWSDEEACWRATYEALAGVPDDDVWDAVLALMHAPGAPRVPPIAPGGPLREGFLRVWRGYSAAPLDRARLERIAAPVYLPVGGASTPRMKAQAERLARHFPNAEVEILDGCAHFDMVLTGADRIAAGIARAWQRSA